MRLLDTTNGRFVSVEDPRTVHYAILSHVWSKPHRPGYVAEQKYQDVVQKLGPEFPEVLYATWSMARPQRVDGHSRYAFSDQAPVAHQAHTSSN